MSPGSSRWWPQGLEELLGACWVFLSLKEQPSGHWWPRLWPSLCSCCPHVGAGQQEACFRVLTQLPPDKGRKAPFVVVLLCSVGLPLLQRGKSATWQNVGDKAQVSEEVIVFRYHVGDFSCSKVQKNWKLEASVPPGGSWAVLQHSSHTGALHNVSPET